MKSITNKAIASIREQSPLKYPRDKYKSPQAKFKIILNELQELGYTAYIKPVFKEMKGMKRVYTYNVLIGFSIVRTYASSASAKDRITREYLKYKKEKDGN